MAEGTRVGTGYVSIQPDFSGFQEKVGKKLNETLGPAFEKAGAKASKRLSTGIDNSSLRNSFRPILKRFERDGEDAGAVIASKIGKGAKRAEGDMFGLAGAIKEMEKRSSSASSRSKILANDTFGIARAAVDAGDGYKLLRNASRDWTHEASKVDSAGKRLSRGAKALFTDLRDVGRNLHASAGGFGSFEGIMARANRGFQFFRNILGSLKLPTIAAGLALAAQSLSALAAGAVATVSALAPLSGALIALPALALAGAQAFGVLKLAMLGVGDAVKAAVTLQAKGGEQATQTMQAQENAAEALADAHRTLQSSERDARYATEDLTKTRKEATRQLEDMERAAKDSQLTEKEGLLTVREARRELNKTLREPGASGLDIQAAEQAVERATDGLEETRVEAKRARADYAEAQKKGVEGMPEVVAAKRSLADANRSAADAERGVAKAVRENSAAMEKQGSAATALHQKMAELTPAGRKFARFLISLKPQFDQLRQTAGKGLFPGATKGLKSALSNLGVVKKVVGETSGALGKLAAKAGAKLGSEAWGRDLGKVGAMNTRILTRMGDAGLNVADAFRNVLVSAEPLIEWMSKGTVKFSEWLKTSAQTGRETGSLSHFFDETREAMEKVWRILKPLGEGLLNVGKAAKPLGNEILDSLGSAAQGWAKWTGSIEGENKLKNYFREVKPAIFAIGRLVRDMTKDFVDLGNDKGVATLVETIRTTLLPVLTNGAGAVTGFVSGFIEKFGDLRKEGVPIFDAFIQVLFEHAVEASEKLAGAMVRGFLNASPLSKLVIGGWLLAKFGGAGAFVKLGKYVGGQFGIGLGETAATSAARNVESTVAGSLGSRLKAGFVSLGKTLGIAMVSLGVFGGISTALSDRKAAHGVGGSLHNFSIGFFRQLGLNIGESTAEEFSKGFKKKVELLADTGQIGVQSIVTPAIEQRAEEQATAPEGTPRFEEEFQGALSDTMRSLQARRASAKELFSKFWEDMGPDERTFAKKLRRALVEGDRLLTATGVKLPPVTIETRPEQTAKSVHKILGSFDYLRKGIGNNLADINRVSKQAGELIVQTFGKGTKESRELTARNMKLTAEAIALQMDRSGNFTKKGLDRIKELIRNADLLSPSQKMAAEFGTEWAAGVDKTKKVTSKAIENIIGEARKMPAPMRKIALETWLEQVSQARKGGDLTAEAFRTLRSKLFAEFGLIRKGSKAFNKEFAEGFVDMANQSGGAMGVLMSNVSNLLGTLGDKSKLHWKIVDAKLSKDPNGASLGRQKGGPVPARATGGLTATVPGNSTGDRHTLSLNGSPVARVESGEGIFVGNRRMMAAAKAANDRVPRFQGGGLVGRLRRGGGLGAEPTLEGNGGPLRQLGHAAIRKVYEGAKGFLDKHKAPAGGGGGSIATAGPLQQFNRIFPSHTLSELSGKSRFSEALVARIARWAGLPGRTFGQIAHGESDFYPGVYGIDPGGTIGRGLWQITSGVGNDAMIARFGGPEAMFNPLINAEIAKAIYDGAGQSISPWYGIKFVTGMQAGGLLRGAAGILPGFKRGGHFDPKGRASKFRRLLSSGGGPVKGTAARAVAWARNNLGTQEGSAKQQGWGPDPWCGYFFGADMRAQGVPLPPNPGYTGSYEDEWAGGSDPVGGLGSAEPGDFLGFNGEHTAMYVGGGQMISGNWGNEVAEDSVSAESEPLTSVRRPRYPGGSGSGTTAPAGAAGPAAKLKEDIPTTYKGAKTGKINFGAIPSTLEAVNTDIRKWEGELPVYGKARRFAENHGKPETAKAIAENYGLISARLNGLRQRRTALRFKQVKKALTKRLSKAFRRLGGYENVIGEAQRGYEIASQNAEQLVGLEPESPELTQQSGESDKAFENRQEAAEKAYAANYSAYVEGRERPAYASVLERVADWRNKILGAETFGFGEKQLSASAYETTWEKQVREADAGIDRIRSYAQAVITHKDAWTHEYEKSHKGQKPKPSDYPQWLTDQLKKRRELLGGELPELKLKDSKLRDGIGQAREQFYPGGKNRLAPNAAGVPAMPIPGSGSLEEALVNVQGIHVFPEQHGLMSASAIGTVPTAGRFGGIIWDVQEAIKGLGLKVAHAIRGSAGGGGGEGGPEDNSELTQLAQEAALRANEKAALSDTLRNTIAKFNKDYPLPPFAGTFHSGGIVPGPLGMERTAIVKAGEGIFRADQLGALEATGSSGPPVIEALHIGADGSARMRYEGREFEVAVKRVVRNDKILRG